MGNVVNDSRNGELVPSIVPTTTNISLSTDILTIISKETLIGDC